MNEGPFNRMLTRVVCPSSFPACWIRAGPSVLLIIISLSKISYYLYAIRQDIAKGGTGH